MKMLMLHALDYWLKPYEKNLESAENDAASISCRNAIVALIHVEAVDEDTPLNVVKKAIKNIKWLARKVGSDVIVLHSFAHLATSRADDNVARDILNHMAERLAAVGFTVQLTPFGYFNEFQIHVAGPSLAKVFVDI